MSKICQFIIVFIIDMSERIVKGIVKEIFEKAKTESTSNSRYGLSRHISDKANLSSRTLERAYSRYIKGDEKVGKPIEDSINFFCKYLGYDNYEDYLNKNSIPDLLEPVLEGEKVIPEDGVKGVKKHRKLIITISIAFGMVAIFGVNKNWSTVTGMISLDQKCMVWNKTKYEIISCDSGSYSKYASKVEPLDAVKLSNFKKVKVTMATLFFSEVTDQPLIWYYKNKRGKIEYYTAPGLHPINGTTLKKITEGIIEKYVPLHSNNHSSFVE